MRRLRYSRQTRRIRPTVSRLGTALDIAAADHGVHQLGGGSLGDAHQPGQLGHRCRLVADCQQHEPERRPDVGSPPGLQPVVQALDQLPLGDCEEPGQGRAAGRGRYSAHGGVKVLPSARRAWPPTGRQHSSRSGLAPALASSNSASAGTTIASPAPALGRHTGSFASPLAVVAPAHRTIEVRTTDVITLTGGKSPRCGSSPMTSACFASSTPQSSPDASRASRQLPVGTCRGRAPVQAN
jgi:hypothetical protein